MLGNVDADGAGLEGDVEMMLAGERAGRLDFAEHAPDDGAQRLLDDLVIGNQAVGRLVAHGATRNAPTDPVKHQSGEPRVGKEWYSKSRARGSTDHINNK